MGGGGGGRVRVGIVVQVVCRVRFKGWNTAL